MWSLEVTAILRIYFTSLGNSDSWYMEHALKKHVCNWLWIMRRAGTKLQRRLLPCSTLWLDTTRVSLGIGDVLLVSSDWTYHLALINLQLFHQVMSHIGYLQLKPQNSLYNHKHLTQKVQITLLQCLDVVRTRLNAGGSILSGETTKQGELTCGSYNIMLLQVLASVFFQNDLFPKTHLPKITPKNIS